MKSLLFTIFVVLAQPVFAANTGKATPLVGVHGMAALQVGETFYASHMPLANSIHAHQVVFSFTLDEAATTALALLHKDNALVSMVPEVFDLAQLMGGTLTQFKANFHASHFERGGEMKLSDVIVTLDQLLLAEPLMEAENGWFYPIALDESRIMYVHQIGRIPSFDQILVGQHNDQQTLSFGSLINFTGGGPWLSTKESDTSLTSIYLETQDFQ